MDTRVKSSETWKFFRRERLIAARERYGLTRIDLAKQLKLTRQYVFRVEEGQRAPSLETMVRWAKALDAPLDIFRDDASKAA